jgi:hypothetical protein
MNAPFSEPLVIEQKPSASDWAKQWRSDCIDEFGRVEHQIGHLLNCLDKVAGFRGLVKRGQPTKPSFFELRKQLAAGGHGKRERRRFEKTLHPIERMLEWRPHLTHGILDVWQCRSGSPLITLKHPEGSCDKPVRWHAYPRNEAEKMLAELQSEAERFVKGAEYLAEQLRKAPQA